MFLQVNEMAFVYLNPNPEKRLSIDCTVRAISIVLGEDWEEAYMGIALEGLFLHDMPSSNKVWGSYLVRKGFMKTLVPNVCPDCCTLSQFCKDHPTGTYLVNTDQHVVAVVGGDYYDTWDSGDEIVNHYWTKEN